MLITDDLKEWLLADDKVCERWEQLAGHVGLHYMIAREIDNTAKKKMRRMLDTWKAEKSESFTVIELKRVLAKEGLHDMLIWISIMTENSPKMEKDDLESTSTSSDSQPSPWSSYLYTTPSYSPTSPYSSFFTLNSTSQHEHSNDYLSDISTPDVSRCSSRLSDHHPPTHCSSHSIAPFQTPPLTSPGRIFPCHRTPPIAPGTNGGVFSDLYRPDLLQLSSVRSKKNEKLNDHLMPVMVEEYEDDREEIVNNKGDVFQTFAHIKFEDGIEFREVEQNVCQESYDKTGFNNVKPDTSNANDCANIYTVDVHQHMLDEDSADDKNAIFDDMLRLIADSIKDL